MFGKPVVHMKPPEGIFDLERSGNCLLDSENWFLEFGILKYWILEHPNWHRGGFWAIWAKLGGSRALKYRACAVKQRNWHSHLESSGIIRNHPESSGIIRNPPETGGAASGQTPLPHAPGARMTVVYTNSFKTYTKLEG